MPPSPESLVASARRADRAVGGMFFAVFGTVWIGLGDVLARGGADWTLAPIALAGASLGAWARRRFVANRAAKAALAHTPHARRVARVFNGVNAGQWALVFVLASVLRNAGHAPWIVPAIMAVVGLHLLPLAAAMRYRANYVTGAALLALAAVFPFVGAAGPLDPVGSIGAGLILWTSAIYGLTAGSRVGAGEAARALRA